MKPKHFLMTAGLCAVSALTSLQAQSLNIGSQGAAAPAGTAATPAAATPAPVAPAPANTFSDAQILETIGWVFGMQSQIDTFAFTPTELDSVLRGVSLAASERDAPVNLDLISPQLEAFVNQRTQAYMARLKQKNQAESDAFFAQLKTQSGVTILPSGLAYEIIKQGTGPNAKATDTVTAHYVASFLSGEVFDASHDPSGSPTVDDAPADIPLADSLPGLVEGLQKINKGGHIKLYIPPALAFGDEGSSGIPPAATLIFDIDVVDIKATPGPASTNSSAAQPATPAAAPAAATK